MITGKRGKFATKRRKFTKRGKKVRLSRGGRLGRGAAGAPAGRESRWGKAGAPQRGGVPNGVPGGSADPVGKGGRAGAARAARSETQGQHESSGGCARRGSARVKRRPRPPQRWVGTREAEAAPAVTVGQHDWGGATAMGAKMPLLMGDQAGRGDHCGKESSWRRIFLRNSREETRQATSAMGKASQTSSSTPVSEKRYATGMRMIS